MIQHTLKTDPEPFQAVVNGRKTFELRYNDRNYTEGDLLTLRETRHTGAEMQAGAPLVFTGREHEALVSHVLRGPIYGVYPGWAILSLGIVR